MKIIKKLPRGTYYITVSEKAKITDTGIRGEYTKSGYKVTKGFKIVGTLTVSSK